MESQLEEKKLQHHTLEVLLMFVARNPSWGPFWETRDNGVDLQQFSKYPQWLSFVRRPRCELDHLSLGLRLQPCWLLHWSPQALHMVGKW